MIGPAGAGRHEASVGKKNYNDLHARPGVRFIQTGQNRIVGDKADKKQIKADNANF